ncbi:hypothetical protein EP331_09185 [bacterium]|nr:MAG: hypothetical protein EP331_09185 [bacterium]
MKRLSLDLFTNIQRDIESRQFHILAALQTAKREFQLNKLYPTLSELLETRRLLNTIIREMGKMKGLLPQSIKTINLDKMEIEFQFSDIPNEHIEQVRNLIEWTLPQLEQVIREGTTIYDFVEEKLSVKSVGIVPTYQNEGYVFIPDIIAQEMALYRFEVSIFKHFDDNYRSLKTRLIKRFQEKGVKKDFQSLKLELIKEHTDLPNPATYAIQTELDFPFDETIKPIVKRMLVQLLK